MAEKLKQCPFCGAFAKAIIDPGCPWVVIKCTQCGAESDLMMENSRYQDNEMAAIAAWNNRAGRDETIEEIAKTFDEDADKMEEAWKEFVASGSDGPATSYHTVYRGIAENIRKRKES